MGKNQHVTPHKDGGWQVKGENNTRATIRTDTQAEKSPELKNPHISYMEGMEEIEKETLLETIRFHREDNSIWNTAEAGK